MKKRLVVITFLLLSVLLFFNFVSADVSSEIQKLTHYAEEYETGNIDYARLVVYTGAVREKLNEYVGVIDRNEGGIMSEEQVRKALGEPTEKTKWVWSEEENRKLDESIPAWRKLVFDGNKIQIYIEAYPSFYRKGHRDENGDFFPDEDAKEEIVYRIHFNINFKQPQESIDLTSEIETIKNFAADYYADKSSEKAEQLAEKMVFVENSFRSSHDNNNCEQTMNNLFGTENKRPDQVIIVQQLTFFEGKDFDVIMNTEMCDECEYHWIGFNFHTEHRGKFRPEERMQEPHRAEGLSDEQYKIEIKENFERLKEAYAREDFSTANSIIAKLQGLQEGWNTKANNVWEEVNRKYESLQRNPPENSDRYYWITIEKQKREEIKKLMETNHEERKQFLNELLSGYEKEEEIVFQQLQWEKRLFEVFRERGEEICDNNVDDNNNGQIDCQEEQCNGKFAGDETITVGEGETIEPKKVQLYCIAGERKQKEEIITIGNICGNHKCDENEYAAESDIPTLDEEAFKLWKESHVLCPQDCSVCPTYDPIECSGKVLFKGKDVNGCSLEPFCFEEQSCESDLDCTNTFRCGEGVCNEDKKCELKELKECIIAECSDGEQAFTQCSDGSQLITKLCSEGLWKETGLTCAEGVIENEIEDGEAVEDDDVIAEEKITEDIVGTACSVKEDCGNLNDVCSNGVCVTLPEVIENVDGEIENIEDELEDENEESEEPEDNNEDVEGTEIVGEEEEAELEPEDEKNIELEPTTANVIFNFFRGLFKPRITGRAITGFDVEETPSENNGNSDSPDESGNSEIRESPEETNNENQESEEELRNKEENERREREEREQDERANRDAEERNRQCSENCDRQCEELVAPCVQTCVFGEKGDESNELEQCKSTCEAEKKSDKDSCGENCKTNCLKGEDFKVDRKGDEHKEELAVFTVGGSCRSSEEKKEAGIHFGGWGDGFSDLHLLKNKYYQDNDEWCKREIEDLIKQRIEFEKSFNREFAQWFLDDYLANSADDWMAHMSGIYDLYWKNVDIQRQLAERMSCIDKRDITEIYQPQLINFEYETEHGKIKFWEELEYARIHDDGEEVLIITPRMTTWIFPDEPFIKTEMKRAMHAREFPGGDNDNGPSNEEKKMIKQNEDFMNLVREVADRYNEKIAVQLSDSETEEIIFNVLMTINEKDIISMQPMLPEETPEPGATIILKTKDVFSLIEKTQKDMQGGHTERPPWDRDKPLTETVNEVVDGISVYFRVRSLINNADIIPADEEKNIKRLAKKFIYFAIFQGGQGEHEPPSEEELDEDIFNREITGEVIRQ